MVRGQISLHSVTNCLPFHLVLNCSGRACSDCKWRKTTQKTNNNNNNGLTKSPASPFGMQIFISEDLAVMISAVTESLLRNTWQPSVLSMDTVGHLPVTYFGGWWRKERETECMPASQGGSRNRGVELKEQCWLGKYQTVHYLWGVTHKYIVCKRQC